MNGLEEEVVIERIKEANENNEAITIDDLKKALEEHFGYEYTDREIIDIIDETILSGKIYFELDEVIDEIVLLRCPLCGSFLKEETITLMGEKFKEYRCPKCNEVFELVNKSYLEREAERS